MGTHSLDSYTMFYLFSIANYNPPVNNNRSVCLYRVVIRSHSLLNFRVKTVVFAFSVSYPHEQRFEILFLQEKKHKLVSYQTVNFNLKSA